MWSCSHSCSGGVAGCYWHCSFCCPYRCSTQEACPPAISWNVFWHSFVCVCVCVWVQASPRVHLTGVGVPQCVLGFKYPPSIEAGRRDKGWGNRKINGRMEPCRYRAVPINSRWGKGDSTTSLTPPFRLKLHHFYSRFSLISLPQSVFPSFFTLREPVVFYSWNCASCFSPPENLFQNVKPCTFFGCFWNIYKALNMSKCGCLLCKGPLNTGMFLWPYICTSST